MKPSNAIKKEFCGIVIRPGCGNNCVFCKKWGQPNKKAIKLQEIDILKNIIYFRKNGYTKIEISGNDPVEYSKIHSLIKYLKKIGFEFIQL